MYSQETPEIKKTTKITNDAIKSFLLTGDVIDRTPTVSAADPSLVPAGKNDLRTYISDRWKGGGGGVRLGIIGVGVSPGSANILILFRTKKCHFHTRFQTWPLRNYISSLLGLEQEKKNAEQG